MKPQKTVEQDILNELNKNRKSLVSKRNKVLERVRHWTGRITRIKEEIEFLNEKITKLAVMNISPTMKATFTSRYMLEVSRLNIEKENGEEALNSWMVKQRQIDEKLKGANNQLDDYLNDNNIDILPCGSSERCSSAVFAKEEPMELTNSKIGNESIDEMMMRSSIAE